MKVVSAESVAEKPVEMPGAAGCTVRWLVGHAEGAPTFAMRQFDVEPGGHTPRHSHPYEHEIYVLAGDGVAYEGDQARDIHAGDVIYVAPDEVHQFCNTSAAPMRFLCLIPHTDALPTPAAAPECGLEVRPSSKS